MTKIGRSSVPALAMLGYGAIADMHARAFRDIGARIQIVAGPNPVEVQAFARRHDIERWTVDVEEAITAPDVDAVVIASPSAVHFAQARVALDAGLHVLVEIPLAMSAGEAEALVTQAHEAERVLMVCHSIRYSEPFRVARAAIERSGLEPTSVVARHLFLRRENVGWTGRRRSWTDNLLWHHGGHVVDVVLGLLGAPVSEVTSAVGRGREETGLPMDYGITLRTPAGAVATISLSYNAQIATNDYLVIGEQDMIEIAGPNVRNLRGPILQGQDTAAVHEQSVLAQDRDFAASIDTGQRPATAAEHVLPAMRILQAVQDRMG
jgi:2-hydroxy-4-carboxymuconate semialdehyde hemiacetal dehydrogenase